MILCAGTIASVRRDAGSGTDNPTLEEMKEYLAGNLCRCTGYMGQLRAIRKYMKAKQLPICNNIEEDGNAYVKKEGGPV